ncbi:MAG TPA: protein translocase subunit SecF, partial [Gammaproteobacteria bacterium]|nr:protein translocase subunit SecF [Gammaproteobacteria bacterium]
MFELFPQNTKIDFLGVRKWAFILAGIFICISVGSLITRGLNFSIDFTGGVLLQVSYPQSIELDEVRGTLETAGFADATVQHFGTTRDVMIRVQP